MGFKESGKSGEKNMTTLITVCETCKLEGWENGDMSQTDGERLALKIEALAVNEPSVQVRRHACLMGCKRGCNVAIQANGKIAYTLGEFLPETEAAEGIVQYATLHAISSSGQVPYKQWPTPIKGHFVTRHPPLPTE